MQKILPLNTHSYAGDASNRMRKRVEQPLLYLRTDPELNWPRADDVQYANSSAGPKAYDSRPLCWSRPMGSGLHSR